MKITMAHGSGGKTSAELMETVFAPHFSNEVLDRMEDAAVLDPGGPIAYSTDTFVVTPLVFPGGDIGKLAVCGTVNDLAMMGAIPRYLAAGFVLEEGLEIAVLERIVASMAKTAGEAGVSIVAGDTKVIEGRGGLLINTSGIGLLPPERHVGASQCRPGDKVLVSGCLGDHHACILSARMGIENTIASDCACLHRLPEALFAAGIPVHAMRDVTRGGLATVLNELASSSHCRIVLEEGAIPVHREVRGFCDILGLDPLYMGNEGKMVVFVPAAGADEALSLLRALPEGKDAAVIGTVTAGEGVTMGTAIGGSRVVDVLYGEGLPRIC